MKIQKLNMQGFAHHFLLAIVVIAVATVGTYYVVASHADTCGTSAPTSGVSSPSSCTTGSAVSAASAPTSTSTTPALTYTATATLASVTNISTAAALTPQVVIKNTGTGTITPTFMYQYLGSGTSGNSGTMTPAPLAKGQSTTVTVPAFKPPFPYTASYSLKIQAVATSNGKNAVFSATKQFTATAPTMSSQTLVSTATTINTTKTINKTLTQFQASNLGKSYKYCATAKLSKKASGHAISMSVGYAGIQGTGSKSFSISTSYTTYCASFTMPGKYQSSGWPVSLTNQSNVPIEVKDVLVKL